MSSEQGLPAAPWLYEAIVAHVTTGILVVDRDLRPVLWNRFMELHSGLAAEQVLGGDLFELFPELPERWLRKKIESVFLLGHVTFSSSEQRPWLFRFHHNRPATGGVDCMQQDCTFFPIKNASGAVEYVGIAVNDATDASIYRMRMQAALRALEEMSQRDPLTGLYNRRYLQTALEQEFNRVRRYGGQLAVLMFDIDSFKQVNDRYGHQAGDEVLRVVAVRTRQLLRKADLAARYGGEEFIVVLPNTDAAGARALAERLRHEVASAPVPFRDWRLSVTVTAGVSELRPDTPDHEALLNEADIALYRGKQAGRNRVACFRR